MYDSDMRKLFNVFFSIAAAGIFCGLLAHNSQASLYAQTQVAPTPKSNVTVPTIHITRVGRLYLNDRPVNINLLAGDIKHNFPTAAEVYIRPDKDTTWDPVSQVLAALRTALPSVSVRFTE